MSEVWQRNLAVPFFTQRDNTYVWQHLDEDNQPFGPKYPMAWRTCNITSLCMVLHYFHITDKTPNEMIQDVFSKKKITEEVVESGNKRKIEKWGWLYEETNETSYPRKGAARLENWSDIRNVAEYYIGERCEYKVFQGGTISITDIQAEIAKGFPVIVSTGLGSRIPGYDKDGHIVVIRGFTDEGDVILNDPFGIPVNNNNEIQPDSISDRVTGYYYTSDAAGIGDNIIIKYTEFKKIFETEENTQYLYIEGPLWQHPGGKETDISNCFPVKSNNYWHDGIHLEGSDGFRSIGCGRLIAARNSEVAGHGSSSFALIKYQKPQESNKFFYALYMHLDKIDLKKELNDFFKKNNGTVSARLRNTWYEQLFNNLLPKYVISYYVERMFDDGQNEVIYEAKYKEGKLIKTENKIKFDDANIKGIESRQMKFYLVPPEKIDFIANIDNYKISNLKFMYDNNYNSKTFIKDGYYFFFCGNSSNRKLCCSKSLKIADSWTVYNEQNYKYYVEKLYELYTGKVVSFEGAGSKITEVTSDIDVEVESETLMKKSLLDFKVIFQNEFDRIVLVNNNIDKSNGTVDVSRLFRPVKEIYNELGFELHDFVSRIDYYLTLFINTGKSEYNKVSLLQKYISKRKEKLEKLLLDIEKQIDANGLEPLDSTEEIKTDKEWLLEIIKDSEKQLKNKKCFFQSGKYTVDSSLKDIYQEFKNILNEIMMVDVVTTIQTCENILIRLVSIPQDKIVGGSNERYRVVKSNTINCFTELWKDAMQVLSNSYSLCFKKHYIDKYIEVPKGSFIGMGSRIPDSNKLQSIHFELFSKENLLKNNPVISAKEKSNFYNPSYITKELLNTIKISEKEKKLYLKFANDGLITSDEIKKLYKEKTIFQELVIEHQSEWESKKYTKEDLKAVAESNHLVGKTTVSAIDFMNEYYEEYNWIGKNQLVDKELGDKFFFFYHPLYFIEKISNDNFCITSEENIGLGQKIKKISFSNSNGEVMNDIINYVPIQDLSRLNTDNSYNDLGFVNELFYRIDFNKSELHNFKMELIPDSNNIDYSKSERNRLRKYGIQTFRKKIFSKIEAHDKTEIKLLPLNIKSNLDYAIAGNIYSISIHMDGHEYKSHNHISIWKILKVKIYVMEGIDVSDIYREIQNICKKCFIVIQQVGEISYIRNQYYIEKSSIYSDFNRFLEKLDFREPLSKDGTITNLIFTNNIINTGETILKYRISDEPTENIALGKYIVLNNDEWFCSAFLRDGTNAEMKLTKENFKVYEVGSRGEIITLRIDLPYKKDKEMDLELHLYSVRKNAYLTGMSINNSNTIFIATKIDANIRKSNEVAKTVIHEVSHSFGLVSDGRNILDENPFLDSDNITGNHCRIPNCIMYKSAYEDRKFCQDCERQFKKVLFDRRFI